MLEEGIEKEVPVEVLEYHGYEKKAVRGDNLPKFDRNDTRVLEQKLHKMANKHYDNKVVFVYKTAQEKTVCVWFKDNYTRFGELENLQDW